MHNATWTIKIMNLSEICSNWNITSEQARTQGGGGYSGGSTPPLALAKRKRRKKLVSPEVGLVERRTVPYPLKNTTIFGSLRSLHFITYMFYHSCMSPTWWRYRHYQGHTNHDGCILKNTSDSRQGNNTFSNKIYYLPRTKLRWKTQKLRLARSARS